jgi:hypothetical protein
VWRGHLDLDGVDKIIFVAPGAGPEVAKNVERYGEKVLEGITITTADGLRKVIPKEYMVSMKDIDWDAEYAKLIERFPEVYCFESGDEEIVNDGRFRHRDMPFADYQIIPHATHNLDGAPLYDFFARLDKLL